MEVLSVVIAFLFLVFGVAKLLSLKAILLQFEEFKYPKISIYIIGVIEIVCSIALFVGYMSTVAALVLFAIVLGAIFSHYRIEHDTRFYFPAMISSILLIIYLLLDFGLI